MKHLGFAVLFSAFLLCGCATSNRTVSGDAASEAPAAAPVAQVEALEELAGTSWIVTELAGMPAPAGETDETDAQAWPPQSLEFSANGQQASGHAGVNRFFGRYTQDKAALRFGPLALTRRAGPPRQTELERTYTSVLSGVVAWRQEGENLVLATAGNARAAVLLRANPSASAE